MATPIYTFDVVPEQRTNLNATAGEIRERPNSYYDGADIAWMMASSALVFLMIPAMSLHYGGTSRRARMHMIWMPIITTSVVGLIWFLWGYAIAFSPAASGFWGGTSGVVLHDALLRPVGNVEGPKIPEIAYVLFQGMFACFTASIVSGATIYKERTLKWTIFLIFWTTLVYCPIAHSSWNPEGWANKAGALDFAGGTPVHLTGGMSSLAYALFYRLKLRRYNHRQAQNGPQRPPVNWIQKEEGASVPTVVIGTVLLWLGWFGFNGGSALGANVRAVSAIVSTQLAACAGGLSAAVLDNLYHRFNLFEIREHRARNGEPPLTDDELETLRRSSFETMLLSFCTGVVAGMVTVTPAAGYISPYFAPIFGVVGSLLSSYAIRLSKYLFDSLDIFAIHAIGGLTGMILTAFFADTSVVALDGYNTVLGGFINRHWIQIGVQLVDAVAASVYSFVVTFVILILMDFTTWFKADVKEPAIVLD